MQKPNARRDALQLVAKGLLTAQEGEGGYRFHPANILGCEPSSPPQRAHDPSRASRLSSGNVVPYIPEQIVDLSPVRQSNGMVVHQLRDGRSKRARAVPREWLGGLDGQMFDDGAEIPQDDDPGDWWSPPTASAPVAPREPSSGPAAGVDCGLVR